MKKLIVLLLLSFCIISSNYVKAQCDIDPELQEILKQKSDELISINIILKSQIDVKKLNTRKQDFASKDTKREAALKEFKQFHEASQADVLSILQAETRSSNVKNVKSHWITNMINCEASSEMIYELAKHPDIAAIAYNKMEYMLFNEEFERTTTFDNITKNILNINGDDVWEQGYTGKGILVSILDTGVNIDHIDLQDHLWDGGEEYPNHGFNTLSKDHNVYDVFGHGTHCAGTICGDGTSGIKTGVAPEATLMCIKVLSDSGEGTIEAIISGVEFSVEHGADLLSLSLGSSFPNTYVSELYRSVFENLLEFNVLAVVAAGNDKTKMDEYPMPRNINAPSNCPPAWIHPDQQANGNSTSSIISIGAVDYEDKHAYFSSEGPVTWSGTSWGDYVLDLSSDLEHGWLDYDNNIFDTCIGISNSFKWGMMFPPSKLKKYENGQLTKVAMYDCAAHNGEIEIYQDGKLPEEGTMIHTQEYSCTGANDFVEFELTTPLTIDHTKNLWIIMRTDEGNVKPAAACKTIHEPNGRHVGIIYGNEYTNWDDLCDFYDLQYTWMIRAFISDDNDVVAALDEEANNEFGLIRPDVCAPGMYIVSSSHTTNDGFSTLSGTSMATPCVAGAVALMLEKNPNLTPAMICEILETTAVKLSDKKNNKTGSGRIDILAAMEKVEKFTEEGEDDENEEGNEDENDDENDDENNEGENTPTISTQDLNIYPNPVEDNLIITTDVAIENIIVYDMYGKTQKFRNSETQKLKNTIDVSDLNSGVYFVKITTNQGETTKLFIKK